MGRERFFKIGDNLDKKILIIFGLLMFVLGFGGGFYTYGLYQREIEVLVPAAIVIGFLTWVGSASDFLGLFRDWVKERQEEQRKEQEKLAKLPKLSIEYDERDKDQYCPILYDTRIELYGLVYRKLLRIRVLNSGGEATGCEAILKVIKKPDDHPHPTTEEKHLQWAK